MNVYNILAGSTDVSVVIRIVDSTDGTPETGVVFNTSGIDLEYRRELAASVDITEATLAALTTAHADGGFLHIGNGYYRLDLPDAAVASGSAGVLIHGTVTGMIVIGAYVHLNPYPVDVRTWLGTAAATPTVAGVPEVDVTHWIGTAAAAPTVAGVPEVDLTHIAGTTAPATRLGLSANTILPGTVDDTVTPTTTQIECDDITEATADHFNGRLIIFTSGALQYQATRITDYALVSGRGRFTVETLTEAPANNDTLVIV